MKNSIWLFVIVVFLAACDEKDEPPAENPEEEITEVILTFTNVADATDIVEASWVDGDGDGGDPPVIDPVNLASEKVYTLTIGLLNGLESPAEDIGQEVFNEADEHMIFFGFTDGLFADPSGDGNLGNRSDPVNYEDEDINGLPLGLETTWTTGVGSKSGSFNVVLKHQPDLKSETSSAADGETDVDVSFNVTIN